MGENMEDSMFESVGLETGEGEGGEGMQGDDETTGDAGGGGDTCLLQLETRYTCLLLMGVCPSGQEHGNGIVRGLWLMLRLG